MSRCRNSRRRLRQHRGKYFETQASISYGGPLSSRCCPDWVARVNTRGGAQFVSFLVPKTSRPVTPTILNLLHRLLHRSWVLEQNPFDHGNWKAAIFDQVIVELTEPEIFADAIFVT